MASVWAVSASPSTAFKQKGSLPAQGSLLQAPSQDSCSAPRPASLHLKRELLVAAGALVASHAAMMTVMRGSANAVQAERPRFYELEGSHGVKALDIREGSGRTPLLGDKVAIHYYARLAAKQGWRFDSTYDHKDSTGAPEPFIFTLGSSTVIEGLNSAVRTMKEGGVRRVIIPPSQGYQNTLQDPVPPNVFDRQRLFTTIFNPTRLANGEGSTLGTLIFDIELLGIRPS